MIDAGTRPYAAAGAKPAGSPLFYSFVAFLLFAPLYKAGNQPFPLLVLELAAVGFLFLIFAVQRDPPAMPRALLAAIAILVVYPLIQIIPLPEAVWRVLPGHGGYVEAIDRFAAGVVKQGTVRPAHTLSVIPDYTEEGWLALLPPLACLLVVLRLRAKDVTKLLLIMVVFAAVEALLGLLQAGTGGSSIVYRPVEDSHGRAYGTFVDPNHFSAFLAMTLPVAIGLIVYSIRHERHRRTPGAPGQPAHGRDANLIAQLALLFASAVMILLCLILTWSRAGIATALVGLACSAVLLPRLRGGVKHARLLVFGLVGAAAVLALLVGITPILEKLGPEHLAGGIEGRWLMTVMTLRAAVEYLPFGSGFSTLSEVFARFQTGSLGGWIDYAHNDYAQAFMELGLAAPAMIGLALAAYGARMADLLRHKGGRSFTILQLAAGIALLPMLLHSAFEFGLHMPSLGMWFATLAGVTFHRGVTESDSAQSTASGDLRGIRGTIVP